MIFLGEMQKANKNDVKAVWEIVKVLEVEVEDPSWTFEEAFDNLVLESSEFSLGGGRGEDPSTTWEKVYEDLLKNIC